MARRVEVEMILVIPVRIGTERRAEYTAGTLVHALEDRSLVRGAIPAQNGQLRSVAKGDRGDVDGPALAMLRDRRARLMVPGAAIIMRRHAEFGDTATDRANRGLSRPVHPGLQRPRRRAMQHRPLA